MGDPLFDAALDDLRINLLCRVCRFELHTAFVGPVMRLGRHPAQRLNEVANQVAGRMHAGIELAALLVDPYLSHAEFYRVVDVMDDPVRILDYPQHLAFTNPAGIKGLSTALG